MFIKFNHHEIICEGLKNVDSHIKIAVRGYIIFDEKMYFDNECSTFILNDYKKGVLNKKIPEYNGCWQIIMVDTLSHKIVIANDRWGSYPLFWVKKGNDLFISEKWQLLAAHTHKRMNEQSTIEMISFGYVLGDKTLIEDINDFSPHAIHEYYYDNSTLTDNVENYWHLHYKFDPANEKQKEKEFAELWQKQLKIYANAIKENGNTCYIPVSGGLDSRLLASEFDKHGIDIFAMTFGSYKGYDEIESALQVVSELHHSAGHFIQYLNHDTLEKKTNSHNYCNRLTTSYFGQLYLDYFYQIREESQFIIPGFSGDFMGGSLIRYRMLKWKSEQDATKYILEQRSAPMVKAFMADDRYRQHIIFALEKYFPKEDDVISNYVRWFTEHDIRRYLIRSVINEENPHGHLLLPFFDYKLIDFFLDLPVKLLINKRLYTNTQIKYLYQHHPELIKIPRSRPSGKVRPVKNAFITEYGNKIKNKIKLSLKPSQGKSQWDEHIDWYKIYKDMELPEFLNKDLIRHPNLLNKPTYIKFFDTVSKVYKELKSC